MKLGKKIKGWILGGLLVLGCWLYYTGCSDRGVFQRCILSPIPASVRDLRSAQTGLSQDWSVSFYFQAAPEDVAKILAVVGFKEAVDSPADRADYLEQWQHVFTGLGHPLPGLYAPAKFYFHEHPGGHDYALVSPETHEVFLTRWEGSAP